MVAGPGAFENIKGLTQALLAVREDKVADAKPVTRRGFRGKVKAIPG
jgi:hypothetical protein